MFSLYMSDVLHVDRGQIGLIYMLGSAVGLFFGPFIGKLADRYGRKPIILISMGCFIFTFVFYSQVTNYIWVYPIQLLEGTAWVAIGASASAFIADTISADRRGWAMGVYQQTISVGWMIGPAFAGFLSEVIGFREVFLLGAGLIVIGFVLVIALVKEPERNKP
jgi:MFS transporter, DHA1 family, tetracycline resistance protein